MTSNILMQYQMLSLPPFLHIGKEVSCLAPVGWEFQCVALTEEGGSFAAKHPFGLWGQATLPCQSTPSSDAASLHSAASATDSFPISEQCCTGDSEISNLAPGQWLKTKNIYKNKGL